MVVKHNMQAMNANRMLRITTNTVSGSTEKLSSGYKINRAADDAAGLAISEKMRKQIRGLDRASENAEDGISCVQTAEGAMAEVQDMLQRMNELCVQAANGTNSVTDRQYIQDEIDQLISEIDRVSESTKFNELYLLKGDEKNGYKTTCITEYSVTYTRNLHSSVSSSSIMPYKVTYKGNNNIFMVPNDIFTSGYGKPITADKIQKGDDVTDYLVESDTEGNKANATLNTDKYATFTTVNLVSTVMTGKNGWVHGDLSTTTPQEKYAYDLSTNGYDNIVRANRELFIYDTQNGTIQKVKSGTEMTEYLESDNTLKDRYRLLDILTADSKYVDNIGASDTVNYYYSGPNSTMYYKPIGQNQGVSISVATGQDITDIYKSIHKSARILAVSSSTNFEDYIEEDTVNGTWKFVKPLTLVTTYEPNIPLTLKEQDIGVELGASINKMVTFYNYGVYMTAGGSLDYYRNYAIPNGDVQVVELAQVQEVITPAVRDKTDSSQRVKDTLLVGSKFSWTDDLLEIETSKQSLYDSNGKEISGMELNKYFDENGNYLGGLYSSPNASPYDEILSKEDVNRPNATTIGRYIVQSYIKIPKEMNLKLHVGSESDRANKIEVTIQNLSSAGLGVDKLSSNRIGIVDSTGENATDAIDTITEALQIISTQRSSLGAIQNRLDHTIKNLDNVVENTTSAESQIRDTDMAEEMVKYSNNNILQQAGQSMLAQANQSNQGILSLLQ